MRSPSFYCTHAYTSSSFTWKDILVLCYHPYLLSLLICYPYILLCFLVLYFTITNRRHGIPEIADLRPVKRDTIPLYNCSIQVSVCSLIPMLCSLGMRILEFYNVEHMGGHMGWGHSKNMEHFRTGNIEQIRTAKQMKKGATWSRSGQAQGMEGGKSTLLSSWRHNFYCSLQQSCNIG